MAKVELPPPEKRLCRKHHRPICPNRWLRGNRTSECAECLNKRARSPEAKKRRFEKWEKLFIPCMNHKDRRCNKCLYVGKGMRRCGSCHNKLASGALRNRAKERRVKSELKHRKRRSFNKNPMGFIRRQMRQTINKLQGAING